MARTKGATDKRRRRRRGQGAALLKPGQNNFKNAELGTRAVSNLARGLNSITKAVEQTRITAKYLGYVPSKVARQAALKENIALINSGTRAGGNILRLRGGILNIGKVQQGFGHLRQKSEQAGGIASRLGRLFL